MWALQESQFIAHVLIILEEFVSELSVKDGRKKQNKPINNSEEARTWFGSWAEFSWCWQKYKHFSTFPYNDSLTQSYRYHMVLALMNWTSASVPTAVTAQ